MFDKYLSTLLKFDIFTWEFSESASWTGNDARIFRFLQEKVQKTFSKSKTKERCRLKRKVKSNVRCQKKTIFHVLPSQKLLNLPQSSEKPSAKLFQALPIFN